MNNLDIKYQSILDIANNISTTANQVNTLLNSDVKSTVGSVRSVWEGEAAEKYQAKFNQLAAQFDTFYQELAALSAFLKNTVETYQAAEKAISQKSEEILDTGSNM